MKVIINGKEYFAGLNKRVLYNGQKGIPFHSLTGLERLEIYLQTN